MHTQVLLLTARAKMGEAEWQGEIGGPTCAMPAMTMALYLMSIFEIPDLDGLCPGGSTWCSSTSSTVSHHAEDRREEEQA